MTAARHPDVLVLGGGIIGLACAHALAARGLAVEVADRGAGPGRAASWAAAGMLAPLAEAGEPGAFLAVCRAARDGWPAWLAAITAACGFDVELDRSGTLVLASEAEEIAALGATLATARACGESAEAIDETEARSLLPHLAPGPWQALLLAGEHRIDNRALLPALAQAAARSGVVIRTACAATDIAAGPGGVVVRGAGWQREAGHVLVAAGAWSPQIAGLPPLPVRPQRGQMLRLAGASGPWSGVVRRGRRYAVRRGADGLLVGATAEEAGFAAHPTPAGISDLLGFVLRLLPPLASAPLAEVWAGLRPATPDGLPILDRIGARIWIATGHHRNGILLAPWTAAAIASAIAGGAALPAFLSLSRFAPTSGTMPAPPL